MIVSTRGRYALRVMIDLAQNQKNGRIPLKEIAERQQISQKYIESIMTLLAKHKLVNGVHGKGGGYTLTRKPEEYKISDILKVTEGSLAPVACLEDEASDCPLKTNCKTLPMWKELDSLINTFFAERTLSDLCR